jgi:predicted dehydrogenase
MSIATDVKEALGIGSETKKIRYAIVGLGSISQEAMMPGVEHTGNSVMTALVTSDPNKATKLAEHYGIENTLSYDDFPALLTSGKIDAIYLATPNWRHAEFAVPALEAGIHVLLEKPMEISSEESLKIIAAQEKSGAKLMVAYRLHFEPATLQLIDRIREGELGQVHLFSSAFSQMVDPKNHRATSGFEAGPVLDMGPYPINAARYVFGAEPTQAFAVGVRHPEAGLGDFDDTVSVILRFPNERLAQFTVSYYANTLDSFYAVGTKGSIEMNPAYMYGMSLEHHATIGDKKEHKEFKSTDHFGGEMKYFSECILNNTAPEPDGYEGLADVRIIEAIHRSMKSGAWEKIEPTPIRARIDPAQVQELKAVKPPELVNASSPTKK